MNKEEILDTLKNVKYPPYSKDIVTFGMVKYVKVDGDKAEIRVYTGGDVDHSRKVLLEATILLENTYPNMKFDVILLNEDPAKNATPTVAKIETLNNVKIKVAVASGKGGVGKSTIAVNLARAFARIFSKNGESNVGLMDCDIHGPSATILFGEKVFPTVNEQEKIVPPEIDGVKVMSMGMLVSEDQPLLWRGPMVTSAIKQFAGDMVWGNLDVMVIDLPPGTGDAVLSVVQLIPLDGAIVVTTANNLASITATRGAMVFEKSNVNIFGLVENMAYLTMPDGSKEFIFGEGFADNAAKSLNTDILARIPIDKTLHTNSVSKQSEELFDNLAKTIISKSENL